MDSDCLCVDRGGSLHPVAGSHQGEIVSHRKTAYCDHLRRGDSRFGCLPCFFVHFYKAALFFAVQTNGTLWTRFAVLAAIPLLLLYNGQRGRKSKWFGTISSIPSISLCCISSSFWRGKAHLRFKIKPGRAALCRVLPYKCGLIRSSRGRTSAPGQT